MTNIISIDNREKNQAVFEMFDMHLNNTYIYLTI